MKLKNITINPTTQYLLLIFFITIALIITAVVVYNIYYLFKLGNCKCSEDKRRYILLVFLFYILFNMFIPMPKNLRIILVPILFIIFIVTSYQYLTILDKKTDTCTCVDKRSNKVLYAYTIYITILCAILFAIPLFTFIFFRK
jgi:hypothetical protein